eukprot:COSAG01_NODE_46600_length_398_cov_6.598662_1_plen_70_part_10
MDRSRNGRREHLHLRERAPHLTYDVPDLCVLPPLPQPTVTHGNIETPSTRVSQPVAHEGISTTGYAPAAS